MSDSETSDEYGAFDFGEFTAEDLAQIDAQVEQAYAQASSSSTRPLQDTALSSGKSSPRSDYSFQFDSDAGIRISQITEEQFLEIDRAVSRLLPPTAIAKPVIADVPSLGAFKSTSTVALSPQAGPSKPTARSTYSKQRPWGFFWKGKKKQDPNAPLMDLFRRKGILSVSDLVGPTWCEVQYDYGLRQRRSRPIHQRPTSFITSSGKEIKVETEIAEKNDVRTKQGQAVHKELEREIRGEELKVDITSEEERWGLRLLNAMACFQILKDEGFTREIPVFGIINDAIVTGIVDEVRLIPLSKKRASPPPARSPKKPRTSTSPRCTHIDGYFPAIPKSSPPVSAATPIRSKARRTPSKERYNLRVVDTKTRTVNWLPPEEDTYSSRLQVMIYRRLLSGLLSLDRPFDFEALWDKADVDPTEEFSTTFMVQAGLLTDNAGFPQTSLEGLANSWKRMVQDELNIAGFDPELELIYRLQPQGMNRDGKGKAVLRNRRAAETAADREERDLAAAIAASLADSKNVVGSESTSETRDGEEDHELQAALHASFPPAKDAPLSELDSGEEAVEQMSDAGDDSACGFKTIGTKVFQYDEELLERHLDYIFQFWRGQRKPEGVPLNLTRRCETCEYRHGCEWREEKALQPQ